MITDHLCWQSPFSHDLGCGVVYARLRVFTLDVGDNLFNIVTSSLYDSFMLCLSLVESPTQFR